MIKNIFVPEFIGDFSLITQRIIALELTEAEVRAALVVWRGKKKTIEKVLVESISQDSTLSPKDRTRNALRALMQQIGSYSKLVAVLPSTKVIFKQIAVPAMSWQKIKMLLPFEIEALLPYPLDQALIDGIILKQGSQEEKSEVLVTAVKQDVMQEFLDVLAEANIKPDAVTTDLVELYSFYQALPDHASKTETTLVIDIEAYFTRLLLLVEGKLHALRIIPQGLATPSITAEKLLATVAVTVEGFLVKAQKEHVDKVILCGQYAEQIDAEHAQSGPALCALLTSFMKAPCSVARISQLVQAPLVHSNQQFADVGQALIVITAALSFPLTEQFNLAVYQADQQTNTLLTKQLIVTLVFIGSILIMLLTNSIITHQNLSSEFAKREEQAITTLTQQLNLTLPKGRAGAKATLTLDQVNNLAQAKVAKEEELWFTLSNQNRFAFLAYLQELSSHINRQELGLELRQLSMSQDTDTITLEGRVKNFEALRAFEEGLTQSKMFKSVLKPQDLKFTVKLVPDKSQRDEA